MKYYIYNKKANNGIYPEGLEEISKKKGNKVVDAIGLDYQKFFDGLNEDDEVVLVGGDGTISYFINHVDTDKLKNKVYLLPRGTGNDFLNDIEGNKDEEIYLNDIVKNLPTVWVNDIKAKFINNVGYGIDGYCCEEADNIKAKTPNKKIDYTSIAIKGLLFKFKPKKVHLKVDGKEYDFKNCWLCPSMKGRYYGGGMMVAPNQDRKVKGQVSVVVFHCPSKIKTLLMFPSIFKGEHVKYDKHVHIFTGKEVEVSYNKPCAVQIDGDTVLNVHSYKVKA